jgi:TolB-like protein/Flp pilus assembly protein TadD
MAPHSPEQIRAQLGKILASDAFVHAERMRRFLGFVVEHSLSSPGIPLKETIVGIELYAPGGDFDPRISAAVRVDAIRLRAKLREYYQAEGATDPLVIDLPKGRYAPVFLNSKVETTAPNSESVEPSVAVLPFSNLSPEPEDYFSDGLTEEIIHALSSVQGIRVVARTSVFAFKDRNADVRQVGRSLNVNYVLEGSVRKSKEALRVTAQFVNAKDGYQLWSRRYDRRIDDVFAVQDEIAHEIVDLLRVSAGNSPRGFSANSAGNFETYELYLHGRYHLNRQTRDALRSAIDCFERALLKNPKYAPAFSGVAVAWLYLGMFASNAPVEAMPRAREAANRALAINPQNGDALAVAACTKSVLEWDWSGAESLFRKSLQAHPGSDLAGHMFAMFALLPLARIEEALAVLEEARRIDPLSLLVSASRGAVLLMARRTSEAESEYRRALELDANFWRALVGLGRCYEANERYDDAISCFERAKTVSDSTPTAIGALGHAYAMAGRPDAAQGVLRELAALEASRYVSPYGRALIYLGLRDEAVFEWLDRSYTERAGWLMYLGLDPRFDPLRGDPRFRLLIRNLGLSKITGYH